MLEAYFDLERAHYREQGEDALVSFPALPALAAHLLASGAYQPGSEGAEMLKYALGNLDDGYALDRLDTDPPPPRSALGFPLPESAAGAPRSGRRHSRYADTMDLALASLLTFPDDHHASAAADSILRRIEDRVAASPPDRAEVLEETLGQLKRFGGLFSDMRDSYGYDEYTGELLPEAPLLSEMADLAADLVRETVGRATLVPSDADPGLAGPSLRGDHEVLGVSYVVHVGPERDHDRIIPTLEMRLLDAVMLGIRGEEPRESWSPATRALAEFVRRTSREDEEIGLMVGPGPRLVTGMVDAGSCSLRHTPGDHFDSPLEVLLSPGYWPEEEYEEYAGPE